jgi:hypothetical protein
MTTHHGHGHGLAAVDDRKLVRAAAGAFGAVFLLVGIAGFIPGITTRYGALEFAGHESGAMLLGVFQVSVLHNLVHLAFGVAGLVMARNALQAAYYLLGGGIVYAVVWLYGLLVDHRTPANFVPVNDADNWLHLILAVAMVALGAFALQRLRGGGGRREL